MARDSRSRFGVVLVLTILSTIGLVILMTSGFGDALVARVGLAPQPNAFLTVGLWMLAHAALLIPWALALVRRLRQRHQPIIKAYWPLGLLALSCLGFCIVAAVLFAAAPASRFSMLPTLWSTLLLGGLGTGVFSGLGALIIFLWLSISGLRADHPGDAAVFD